jgi:hypothetical protein
MADHILCDIYRDEALTIMDCDGVPNQFRKNDGATGPGSDDALLYSAVHRYYFLEQFSIDKGAFP